MGHSIQTFGGKFEVINDIDLMIFIGFAIQTVSQTVCLEPLRRMTNEWQLDLLQYGAGVIDLEIQELLQTPLELRTFAALLESFNQQTTQYRETIPSDVLHNLISVPGVIFFDYKASFLTDTVNKLRTLMADS